MARSRFPRWTILAIALAATQLQAGWSDDAKPDSCPSCPAKTMASGTASCVIYSLRELGDDASLGAWIAKTIPTMIQPGTWDQAGGPGRLTYHAPAQVMAIAHTPAVHAQVDAFLKDLKKARAKGRPAATSPQVMPAHYLTPVTTRPAEAKSAEAMKASAYPVPAPLTQPKHLFHLIIRYEGDGIVDANVAGLIKELSAGNAPKAEPADKSAPEPAKTSALNHLLHFIVRYEGDGIIDANVAALLKEIYAADAHPPAKTWVAPIGSSGPSVAPSSSGTAAPAYVPPATPAGPSAAPGYAVQPGATIPGTTLPGTAPPTGVAPPVNPPRQNQNPY